MMILCKNLIDCLMQVWLKQPLTSSKEIGVRHDVVEAFAKNPELREKLRDQHLRGTASHLLFLHLSINVAIDSCICYSLQMSLIGALCLLGSGTISMVWKRS